MLFVHLILGLVLGVTAASLGLALGAAAWGALGLLVLGGNAGLLASAAVRHGSTPSEGPVPA